MRIGIIGTGPVGRTLGGVWVRAGHEVVFGSRDPARAAEAVAGIGIVMAQEQAAAFGDVVLWTARGVMPADPSMLAGKIVLDPNNREPARPAVTPHRVMRDKATPSNSRRVRRGRTW